MLTVEMVNAADQGPQLDSLLHEHYGDGELEPIPPYSTSWEFVSSLADRNGIGLSGIDIAGNCSLELSADYIPYPIGVERLVGDPTGDSLWPLLAVRALLKLKNEMSKRGESETRDRLEIVDSTSTKDHDRNKL